MIVATGYSSSGLDTGDHEIVVLPKTDFNVAAAASSTRTTKLAVGIDISAWRNIQLVTLVHRIDTPWEGTGSGMLWLNAIGLVPEDPSTLFSGGNVVRGTGFGASTLAGTIDIVTATPPIPSLVEVALVWTQGATPVSTTPNSFAISVRLVGRRR